MTVPVFDNPVEFSEIREQVEAMLSPCPMCGAGTTCIYPNWFWTGMRKSLISVEIKHWCTPRERQPQRALIVAGSTLEQVLNAWNQRVYSGADVFTMKPELIVSAAMWFDGNVYALPAPNRHADIIRHFGGFGGPSTYGFMTNRNRFVMRKEGMQIAKAAGQLLAPSNNEDLYTEDLW